jgi:hypothetical protein
MQRSLRKSHINTYLLFMYIIVELSDQLHCAIDEGNFQ